MFRNCLFLIPFLVATSVAAQRHEAASLRPFRHENLYGYQDASGQTAIKPQFTEALPFTGAYAYVRLSKQWGLINEKGKMVIPATHEALGWSNGKTPPVSDQAVGFRQGSKWGLLSLRNKIIVPTQYDSLIAVSERMIKVGKRSLASGAVQFGLMDEAGNERIPLIYPYLSPTQLPAIFIAGVAKASCPDGYAMNVGLINDRHEILLPLRHKQITETAPGKFTATPFPQWQTAQSTGEITRTYEWDSLYALAADVYAFLVNGQAGYFLAADSIFTAPYEKLLPQPNGLVMLRQQEKYGLLAVPAAPQLFVSATYDSIRVDTLGYVRAGKRTGSVWDWQLIRNDNGAAVPVSQPSYQFIDESIPGKRIRVKRNHQYGMIDSAGNEIIPVRYDSLEKFTDSLAVAVEQGKYGVLHHNGHWHFLPEAEYYALNQFGYAIRRMKGVSEVIDRAGNPQFRTKETLRFLPDGSIQISQAGKVGRISPSGKPCVPTAYDSISRMTPERTFWAFAGKDISLFNAEGTLLVKPGTMGAIQVASNEFSPVKVGSSYGFVDGLGRLRIGNRYEDAQPFREGVAAVKLAGKWGFINRSEKIAVQPRYDEVTAFQQGVAIARRGKKYGLVDRNGKELSAFAYERITPHKSGAFITSLGRQHGLLAANGREISYPRYEAVFPQPIGQAIVQQSGKFGLINAKGILVLPVRYDAITRDPFTSGYFLLTRKAVFTHQVTP